ncbi:hypothetical protein [uncultured Methanomethylovorans sp.]|uniref:hypothetical protein n=1 Tax=uncultured Methanomethylovorans sp. TaxID=183759 RepID=UPI0037490F17
MYISSFVISGKGLLNHCERLCKELRYFKTLAFDMPSAYSIFSKAKISSLFLSGYDASRIFFSIEEILLG